MRYNPMLMMIKQSELMDPKKKSNMARWVADALKHAGMKQAELARQLEHRFQSDFDRTKVNKILKDKREVSANEMIAIEEITRFPAPVEARAAATKNSGKSNSLKLQPRLGETNVETNLPPSNYRLGPVTTFKQSAVPIRGRAMAGKEGVLQFGSDDVVGWADAPEKLANLPGAYAVYVLGGSMEPVLENGFVCHVNPNLPPARGLAVIQVSSDDGVTVEGFVKHLISVTDSFVKVCQYNPKKTITFQRKHVLAIHRIVLSGPPY